MKKYPNLGYAIKNKPQTIDMEYKKMDLKMDFRNQNSYFQEYIDDILSEPLCDELEPNLLLMIIMDIIR